MKWGSGWLYGKGRPACYAFTICPETFVSEVVVELSDESRPLLSKKKYFGLQPPLFHESFIFFSDESDKFSWLKIFFRNNKKTSISDAEEAQGTAQSSFYFRNHGSRTTP